MSSALNGFVAWPDGLILIPVASPSKSVQRWRFCWPARSACPSPPLTARSARWCSSDTRMRRKIRWPAWRRRRWTGSSSAPSSTRGWWPFPSRRSSPRPSCSSCHVSSSNHPDGFNTQPNFLSAITQRAPLSKWTPRWIHFLKRTFSSPFMMQTTTKRSNNQQNS